MKNKASLYILLPVVLGLWGYIVYKIVIQTKTPKENALPKEETKSIHTPIKAPDTFTLNLNYPDPFLKNKVADKPAMNTPIINKVPTPPKKTLTWPSIKYLGLITNVHSNKKVFILDIGGKNHVVKEGEKLDNITVVAMFPDSIKLKMEAETRTFTR